MKTWQSILVLALPLTLSSCRDDKGIYPVTGKVNCDGRPADGAALFFFPHGTTKLNDPMIMGIVRPDGTFDLVCGSLGKGAPPGDYDVVIQWRWRLGRNGASRGASDRLGGRYADPKHPLLHARVEAEANELPPFELTSGSPVPKS